MPLGSTAPTSATDLAIHKKNFGSSVRPSDLAKCAPLIILQEEMNYIMKIVKYFEESDFIYKKID